jgi:NAD(P)-dependent dehydrogenase (short-subunit alcohol dehydrogenase family)
LEQNQSAVKSAAMRLKAVLTSVPKVVTAITQITRDKADKHPILHEGSALVVAVKTDDQVVHVNSPMRCRGRRSSAGLTSAAASTRAWIPGCCLSPQRVRVNAIAPSATVTERVKKLVAGHPALTRLADWQFLDEVRRRTGSALANRSKQATLPR